MKLTPYCLVIVALSAIFCQTQPTPSRQKLALSGAAHAALALASGYATYQTALVALRTNEIATCWETLTYDYASEFRGNRSLRNTFTYQYNKWGAKNVPFTILRPCAYASLLYVTGRVAVTQGKAAYNLLKEAYTGEKQEAQQDKTSSTDRKLS